MTTELSVGDALAEPEYRVEGHLKVTGRARYAADASDRGLVDAGRRIAGLERQIEEARAALKKHERRWWQRLF